MKNAVTVFTVDSFTVLCVIPTFLLKVKYLIIVLYNYSSLSSLK